MVDEAQRRGKEIPRFWLYGPINASFLGSVDDKIRSGGGACRHVTSLDSVPELP